MSTVARARLRKTLGEDPSLQRVKFDTAALRHGRGHTPLAPRQPAYNRARAQYRRVTIKIIHSLKKTYYIVTPCADKQWGQLQN